MTATYSLAEVGNHNTKGDLWIVIHGKVYDLSKFVEDHPGGEDAIYEESGKDATTVFEDIGHSEYAIEQLDDLYIGDLEGSETVVVEEKVNLERIAPTPAAEKKTGGSALRVIIPTIIVAGLLVYKLVLAPQQKN